MAWGLASLRLCVLAASIATQRRRGAKAQRGFGQDAVVWRARQRAIADSQSVRVVTDEPWIAEPVGGANAAEQRASANSSSVSFSDFAADSFGFSPPHRSPFSFGGNMSWRSGSKLFIEIWPAIQSSIPDRQQRIEFTGELLKLFVRDDMDPYDVEDVYADIRAAMRRAGI